MSADEMVYIANADQLVCEDIQKFFSISQVKAKQFDSVSAFFAERAGVAATCVIIDLCTSIQHGLDLQRALLEDADPPQIIFTSADCSASSAIQAMKAGAFDFFDNPVDFDRLLESAKRAMEYDKRQRGRRREIAGLRERLRTLTLREKEVLPFLVSGFLQKQTASVLGITQPTLQAHRANIMRKMQANSLPDLVRMAMKLGIRHASLVFIPQNSSPIACNP